ncbi:Hypothetical Protein FCC1311_109012 [Hondaea fermentalgiana]|uniref:OTU domain-containing protein n=1 Tax=Hondaea fermentalgiana TaxID=2315210 RepID=A0A2R5GWH1_9STRA|nr:Hypothetical Protein FCC1311_109012 [Hondaea fermentalgiana]|eukprot:GBG34679.1 Hypothetical Protein FCC1311_109012 [Hondaea fermentalgiana]
MAAMARSLTPDELMSDPAFARKVNEEWEEIKSRIKRDVRDARSNFKRKVPDRFVEAMKIYNRFDDFFKAGQWDNAFYCLHLYLECVLPLRLNRPQESGPRYEKQAAEVQETLDRLQGLMNRCMDGIRLQIIEKNRAEEEARRRDAAASGSSGREDTGSGRGSTIWKRASSSLTAKQAALALDALRLDGKKTNVKLYGMDVNKPSRGLNAPQGPPPPSYGAAVAASSARSAAGGTRMFSTVRHNEGFDDDEFQVKSIMGDGNCAFRAIVQGQHGGNLSREQETRLALQLRADAAAELRRCADEEMTGTGLTVEQLVLMKDDKFPTFNEYVDAMSRNEYAGETEFWLIARKHNMNIAIFQPQGGGYEHMLTYGDASDDPVRLLWQLARALGPKPQSKGLRKAVEVDLGDPGGFFRGYSAAQGGPRETVQDFASKQRNRYAGLFKAATSNLPTLRPEAQWYAERLAHLGHYEYVDALERLPRSSQETETLSELKPAIQDSQEASMQADLATLKRRMSASRSKPKAPPAPIYFG